MIIPSFIVILILAAGYWLCLSPTSQIFGRFSYHQPTTKKIVALTFDDGPNEPYTSLLLNLLHQQKVPATFFVVGKNLKKHPAVVLRAAQEGHLIGNHSLSHRFRNYFLSASFATEISANQDLIAKTIGQSPVLYRPPWLFRTPMILITAKRLGLKTVSGTFVNNLEIFQPSAAKIAATAYRRTRPGTILIFHDGYNAKGGRRDQTIAAVEQLIKRLRTDGYNFVTVSDLLNVHSYQA